MTFRKGDPKPAAGGRKKGVTNKATKLIKDAITDALVILGKGDMTNYFVQQGRENPVAFLGLVGKIIPTQIDATSVHDLQITHVVREIIDHRVPVEPLKIVNGRK